MALHHFHDRQLQQRIKKYRNERHGELNGWCRFDFGDARSCGLLCLRRDDGGIGDSLEFDAEFGGHLLAG
jgi:hypothetical protein